MVCDDLFILGFHSRASRCASAIWAEVICLARASRASADRFSPHCLFAKRYSGTPETRGDREEEECHARRARLMVHDRLGGHGQPRSHLLTAMGRVLRQLRSPGVGPRGLRAGGAWLQRRLGSKLSPSAGWNHFDCQRAGSHSRATLRVSRGSDKGSRLLKVSIQWDPARTMKRARRL